VCHVRDIRKMCTSFWWGKLKERDCLEYLGVDGRITLGPMYQFNDRLTQLYKYIWLWLQCFDLYLGHCQVYIMNLENVVPKYVLHFLSLYRPDDDPDKVKTL
jgi:hypothetical protein